MSFKYILYILFFNFCFSFSSKANTISNTYKSQITDSLQIDDSAVYPKQFDDLKRRYNDSDFIYERTKQSSGWWTRFKESISNFFRDLFNFKNAGQASNFTDTLLKIAGIIVILLVIFFIFKAIVNKEGNWVFGKSSDKKIIPVTDIESNIHTTDFKTLIQQAEADNNFRLAVRYYYLWLLKYLTQNEIIEYDVEKTNSDYQNEISSKDINKQFAYTSYLYNYIWYGEFNINDKEFDKAKHAFLTFINSLKA
ncbi:DUF4129 domain-containing protein [uncultured Lacinutrix sp.]|uniref:DUF4129 domain-containing protein n=1 Tax=uncultured Lacinutrix sp. TaxID=574032 RepID=UPI00262C5DC8|nr:DUF4129 domain-containing protein [uncultured Lacinutrix sp.]